METGTAFVDGILEGDRKAPRKQRHTAHRIWQRIQHELPECNIAERTVRQYVQQRKAELGLKAREAFVPQSYAWGAEAQVDFYEGHADLGGERVKLQVFAMRSMASGAAFHCAYRHATQQAFLEAHERAFAYFGGVFRKLRYDNLGAAVRKILRGHRREETARFIAFRSHWRFEAEFCTPAEAHENAYVESFNGKLRDECLNVSWFRNLWQARARIEAWRKEYNCETPAQRSWLSNTRGISECWRSFASQPSDAADPRTRQGNPAGRLRRP